MTNAQFRYWKDGRHILVESDNWDCFLRNESLNPLINWLNFHHKDINEKIPCRGIDKINEVEYISSAGGLTIKTNRDVVFLTSRQLIEFIDWLKKMKDILSIRKVWP